MSSAKAPASSSAFSLYGTITIRGVLPVLHLPYHDDYSIDFDTLAKEVDWAFEQGCDGVVIAMVTEIIRLSDVERDQLIESTVRSASNRGPVIASVGAESSMQAIRHAKAAEAAGASALMAIPPGLTRCAPSETITYYEAILSSTSLPLIVQDASGYLGNAIPTNIQAELFHRHPERVGFKPEAQPFGANLSSLRDSTRKQAAIFEGTGGIALIDSFQRGIAGTMPGTDLCWAVVALWRALKKGDLVSARKIHAPLSAIISSAYSLDAFLAIEKLLLVEQKVFKNTWVRGPVGTSLDPETISEIRTLFGLLRQSVLETGFLIQS